MLLGQFVDHLLRIEGVLGRSGQVLRGVGEGGGRFDLEGGAELGVVLQQQRRLAPRLEAEDDATLT